MELHEFQILQRKTGAGSHRIAVARTSVGTRAAEVCAPVAASRQHSLVCSESVEGPVLHVYGDDANTFTVLHDQIKCKIFDEKVGIVAEGLAVEGVQQGMTSAIRGGSTSICLSALSVLQRMAPDCSLIYLAVLRA
jgi:hypothetical protein